MQKKLDVLGEQAFLKTGCAPVTSERRWSASGSLAKRYSWRVVFWRTKHCALELFKRGMLSQVGPQRSGKDRAVPTVLLRPCRSPGPFVEPSCVNMAEEPSRYASGWDEVPAVPLTSLNTYLVLLPDLAEGSAR